MPDVEEKVVAEQPIPEPFPGFGDIVKSGIRDARAANQQLQSVETSLVTHQQSKWQFQLSRPKRSVAEWIEAGRPGPFSDFAGGRISGQEAWEAQRRKLLNERQDAVRQVGRSAWFRDFYDAVPNLLDAGVITNFEEYLALVKSDPTGILSEEDMQTARSIMTRILGEQPLVPRPDAPEFLAITPEQEAAVRTAFALEPAPPETIHRITVNSLLKSLTRHPDLSLPDEMTAEELLQFAAIMDIPAEDVTRAIEYTELIQPFANAIVEREEKIKAVLAGEEEWKMPELSVGQQLMFTVLSPFQAAADVIKPYLEKVSYPIAGFAAFSAARFLAGTQDIEDKFAKMKSLGYTPWQALSEAYQEWELPWYYKLPIELITDPIMYIPGLLLSIPAKLLRATPWVATRALGIGLNSLNRSMWAVLDVPFDAAKAFWARLPKSFNQATRFELNSFRDLIIATSTKTSGRVVSMLSPDDLTKALEKSMKAFVDNPMKQGDVFVDLGAELTKHAPLGIDDVKIWSRSLGGQLDEVTPTVLTSVDDTLRDVMLKMGSPAQNAKRLAIAMGIEDTSATIAKLVKDIGVLTNKYAARVPRAIEIGRTAKINPTLQMTEFLVSSQRAIIRATERSEYAKGKALSGFVLGLMNKVDKLEQGVFRMTLDRWLVRPTAEAYLGSVAYPIWNAFESIFVSALEGVVPRAAKMEAFQRMFIGIRGVDARVMQWSASDVAGMLGTMPGREGAISLLPGKIPEKIFSKKTPKWISGKDWFEWTGRKWIELSDTWGTGFRANFLMRKMASFLAEFSYDVAGQDLNIAFRRLIGTPPGISKSTLGLSSHELKQEMFTRMTTGLKSEVLGMKELLSNTGLMHGEALKTLRSTTELSLQAKTIGEQLLAKGKALDTVDDVVKFSKTVADQSIADLRAYPTQAPASFRFMADQMESVQSQINTPDDLMQIFQHFEVMSDTASKVPTRLLAQTFDEADILKQSGKFNQLETLWRTSRREVEDATDSINDSLARARAVIESKSSLLTEPQQNAMLALLERNTARAQLQEQFLRFDSRLLDDFWALPKAQRTGAVHTELRAFRQENMSKFRGEDAVLGAGDFLERRTYSQLFNALPRPKRFHVDASNRALSPDDLAKAMGANVDALTTGMMESMAFQDKVYFIQMVKQSADASPSFFKGFTAEKIGLVYDDIIRGLKMTPGEDIATQKLLQQVEGMKQKLLFLRMNKSLKPAEEQALHGWIDDVAGGMDNIFGTPKKAGIVTQQSWEDIRQRASDSAHREYYKAFADYTNENIIDAVGKSIYPFWTYHMYRWFFLPRTFIRKPGTMAAWGKYYEYSDYGYQHIPGTDIEFNPAIGSAFGATFSLGRHDFKSYYENLGFLGEILDATQRRGFFPGIHVTLPIALTPLFSGRPPELGEVLPPLQRVGLNLLVNSKIPGVADSAKWLKDRVFHENFHDYYTATIVSRMQSDAGGTLIDGQSGADLWEKKQRGEVPFTEAEALVWDKAFEEAAWIAILRSEFPEFRLRAEEMLDAQQHVASIIEAETGMDTAFQDNLWRHNMRPADVIGGLPRDLQDTLDQMWQWRIYFGRGKILMPPEISDLFNLIGKYAGRVESFQTDRIREQSTADVGFLSPTPEVHFNGAEWRREYANNWSAYITNVESLEKDPEYTDAIDAMTPEGQIRLAKELGFNPPRVDTFNAAVRAYFEIELHMKKDKFTGEEDWDYLRFWIEREAVRTVLPEEHRGDFDAYVRRFKTPMEQVFRDVSNVYLRGYRAVSRIVLEEFTDEEKALIAEFYADTTSRERKLEIKEFESHSGKKLISFWDSRRTDVRTALRRESPVLDFWLFVFGYTTSPKTDETKAMIDAWEKDRNSIVQGVSESFRLEEVMRKIEEQKTEETTE